MAVGEPRISFPDDDPLRTYTEAENRRLTDNLAKLIASIHAGELSAREPSRSLLCDLHRRLFEGVREHAGRHRSAIFGSERLSFGPNRSASRGEVEALLEALFRDLAASMRSLEANQDDPDYDASAIHISVWAHARVIQIHPFEDGNGRTSRALLGVLLVKAGLQPIPIEAVKEEYNEALNTFFRERTIAPLFDLFLRLYGGLIG